MSSKEAYMHKKDQALQADKLNKRPYALLRAIPSEGNNKKHYIFSGNGNSIIRTRCGAVVYGAYYIFKNWIHCKYSIAVCAETLLSG